MKIQNYSPTFRNILLKQVEQETKTSSGLYIPTAVLDNTPVDEMAWLVVKTGKDCQEVKVGDTVYLNRGIYPEPIGEYFQVMEMQIKGYERSN